MNTVFNDLRYALRMLRRAPGFALTSIATLALGIGATTVVYSIVDAVLLRPLPFPRADRLVELDSLENLAGGATRANDTSYPNFFDWRTQAKAFQSMASYKSNGFTLDGLAGSQARRITGIMVGSEFFSTLGVQPMLGRGFRREEEQPGNRSVVIGSELWHQQFGDAPDVVGKTLRLDDEAYSIIGVMPRGFLFPLSAPDAQLWVTSARDAEGSGASATQRGYNQLDVVARLSDGVTLEQARAELNTVQQGLALRYPDDDKNMTNVSVVPELEALVGDVRQPLRILLAAVGFLLLIACANAAGLFLTRTRNRAGELSVRAALGASRGNLLRQLLVEALLLSLGGALLGVGLAALALKAAPQFLPANLVRAQSIAINGGVLGFALCAAFTTGLLFGVLPAWRVSRLDPTLALSESRRGTTGGRRQHLMHGALVIAETALSLILLTGAGLLIRSFDRVMRVDPGFAPQHMLTFRVSAPDKHYDDAQRVALFNRIMTRLQGLPGVESVSAAFPLPLAGSNIQISFSIQGQPVAEGDEPSERVSVIAPRFFETLHIPLLHGRFFRADEQSEKGQPVVIVNEAFASKYFGKTDPIGQHLRSGLGIGPNPPMREIVGVVGDVKRANLMEPAKPEYYIPIEQAPIAAPAVAMRVSGDPASYDSAVRSAVAEIDRSLPVYRLRPYADDMARTSAEQRFQTLLIGSFAAIALLLAAVGLYSLLNYMVVLRRRELGLRIALGAQRSNVLGLILGRGLILSGTGLLIGLCSSALLTRFLLPMLFQVNALDPFIFFIVSLVMLMVASLASLLPAYRASRLDPIETLRMN
jgi:predicted permease